MGRVPLQIEAAVKTGKSGQQLPAEPFFSLGEGETGTVGDKNILAAFDNQPFMDSGVRRGGATFIKEEVNRGAPQKRADIAPHRIKNGNRHQDSGGNYWIMSASTSRDHCCISRLP